MSVSVFSYAGKVTVGFLTDAGLVPDPQALADALRGRCWPSRAAHGAGDDRTPGAYAASGSSAWARRRRWNVGDRGRPERAPVVVHDREAAVWGTTRRGPVGPDGRRALRA